MRKLTYFMLCLTSFSLPWEHFIDIPGIGGVSQLLGYATIFFALIAVASRKSIRPLGLFHLLVAAFVLLNILSIRWSVNTKISYVSAMRFLRMAGMVWLIYEFTDDNKPIIRAFLFGCLSAVSQMAYSYLTGDYSRMTGDEGRYSALGMNENDLALVLVIGAGLAYYLVAGKERESVYWKIFYWVFSVVAMVAAMFTGSRTGMLAMLGGVSFLMVTQWRGGVGRKVMLAVALVTVFAIADQILPEDLLSRYTHINEELKYGTLTGRAQIWEAGLEVFKERPVAGFGSGAFPVATERYFEEPKAPHNTYLALLVETGVIGLALFLSLFILCGYYTTMFPSFKRNAWRAILVACVIGFYSLGWDYRKPTWFILGLIAHQYFSYHIERRRPGRMIERSTVKA